MKDENFLNISLGITTGLKLNKSLILAKLAEKNNYKTVWVGDDILKEEIFTYISILANNLKKINIAAGIVSPYIYKINSIASNAATLSEITHNKFILGLGVGGTIEVEKLTGNKPKNVVEKMENSIDLLRKIFSGQKVSFDKNEEKLKNFKLSFGNDIQIPIYFGVRGPKLLDLAGKLADGIIFSAPLDILHESIDIVNNSAKSAGRDEKLIEKVLWNGFIFSESNESLKLAKDVVMIIVSSMSNDLLKKIKIDLDLAEIIKKEYKLGNKKNASELITEELIRKMCIYGSTEDIKNYFSKLIKLGINEVIIGPPFGINPEEVLKIFNPKNLWRK